MQEIALFSGKFYTAGTNFTRPPVVTVATNLNSEHKGKHMVAFIFLFHFNSILPSHVKEELYSERIFWKVSLLCCRTGQWQLNRQQVICVRRYCLLWQSEICGNKSQCRIRLCSQVIYLATAFLPAFLSQSNIYRLVRMLWEKVTSYFWRYWECYGMTTAFFAA